MQSNLHFIHQSDSLLLDDKVGYIGLLACLCKLVRLIAKLDDGLSMVLTLE
jgi:hypothetical protein